MSVLLETSLGDIVIDLYYDECPRTCLNFLKLCKLKYFNYTPFHQVQKDFIAQTGDPTGTGKGGESVWGLLRGPAYRYFPAEVHPRLKHRAVGTVSMAVATPSGLPNGPLAGSQFLITTGADLDYLDGKYAVFGQVAEGLDVLQAINEAHCDGNHVPYRDIRIRHTIVLDDPFPDPPGLIVPDRSPLPTPQQVASIRIADYESIDDDDAGTGAGNGQAAQAGNANGSGDDEADIKAKQRRSKEAQAQALTLEMIGDLPFADIRPPENILFVCKLNPITNDDDLQLIFARFGEIISCQVIRDRKSGDSLGYAFIEFGDRAACEQAYFKMNNVLIDDRRIKVDFSQSVSHLHQQWVA
ncbi:putative peptidyl-prolyl cis-trans isomerase-like 4, partial [Dimargaris cristalligena]